MATVAFDKLFYGDYTEVLDLDIPVSKEHYDKTSEILHSMSNKQKSSFKHVEIRRISIM